MKPLAVLALAAALVLPFDDKEQKTLERGRDCCRRFFSGEVESLWKECDEGMRGVLKSEENLRAFRGQVGAQLGAETAVVEEKVETQGFSQVYVRRARFDKVPQVVEVVFGFDAEDRITTFVVRPVAKEAPSEFLEYRTKTKLRLPFDDEWTVFWGGRTIAQNYHAATVDQRFAYDIVIVKDGKSHAGEGTRNEDYHCFGRPILAPAAGVVAVAVDGIEDNVPGEMNASHPPGNHVILDHGNGEYSLLARFQKGSVAVKKGERVESGAKVGLCGNSGNSSEPHLHYHLQNAPEFRKGQGLPAQFEGYVADGKAVERGEPVKGQRIKVR